MNLNKVFVLGRMTADPELRSTPTGASVTSFGVATNRVWYDKNNQKQEETEFHNIVAWGKQAEVASKFLKKGTLVLIEGRMRTRSWEDKQGQSRKTTEIICERLQLGPKAAGTEWSGQKANAKGGREEAPQAAPEEIPTVDLESDIKPEDLPF